MNVHKEHTYISDRVQRRIISGVNFPYSSTWSVSVYSEVCYCSSEDAHFDGNKVETIYLSRMPYFQCVHKVFHLFSSY